MEFEFDKEIDALLRQTAQGEAVSANRKSEIENPKSPHLDADEISLFAENALPEKTKALYTEHFADCQRCRKILSNVIALDSEIAKKIIPALETAKISSVVPWYQRLFAAPNLAPALGALVLVFAGLIAFSFLQNSNNSENAEIAQVESTEKMSGPNAGGDAQIIESNSAAMSNGGAMSSNSGSAMSNSSVAIPTLPVSPNGGAMSNGASVSNSAASLNKRIEAENKQPKNEAQTADGAMPAKQSDAESLTGSANFTPQIKPKAKEAITRAADDNDAVKTDAPQPAPPQMSRSAPAELSVNGRNAAVLRNARAKNAESDASAVRTVNGKNFRRENGVWYDASYNGQATTNVSRSSEDFKKLDSGLRSIAGSLNGALVVVYQGRAYRIQ